MKGIAGVFRFGAGLLGEIGIPRAEQRLSSTRTHGRQIHGGVRCRWASGVCVSEKGEDGVGCVVACEAMKAFVSLLCFVLGCIMF